MDSTKVYPPVSVSLSAEGGLDSGQGSSVFSSDSPHLGQLTMSYSCPPSTQPPSQPQTPYPSAPSATPQQQHPGYAQPPQPMVSVLMSWSVGPTPASGATLTGVLEVFEVSTALCFGSELEWSLQCLWVCWESRVLVKWSAQRRVVDGFLFGDDPLWPEEELEGTYLTLS